VIGWALSRVKKNPGFWFSQK